MRRTADEMSWVGMCISGKHMNNLRFADDVMLIATSPERLQALIDEVDRISKEFQLEISTSKTKIMATTNEPQQLLIRCRGEPLAQVEKFKYLGSIIEQKADCSYEIRGTIGGSQIGFQISHHCLERSCTQQGHQAEDIEDNSMASSTTWLRVLDTKSSGYQQTAGL